MAQIHNGDLYGPLATGGVVGAAGQILSSQGAGQPTMWVNAPKTRVFYVARTAGQATVLSVPVDVVFLNPGATAQSPSSVSRSADGTEYDLLQTGRTYLVRAVISVTAGGSVGDTLTIVGTDNNPVGVVNVPYSLEGSPKRMEAIAVVVNVATNTVIKVRFTSSAVGTAATIGTQGFLIIERLD